MKIFTCLAASLTLVTGSALADELLCERDHTFFDGGQLVDTDTLTFYAHGCDRFQYRDIGLAQAAALLSAGQCSIEASADGNGCGAGYEETEDGECVSIRVVEFEVEFEVPALTQPRGVANGAQFDRDNLTSMGVSAFDGQNVMRVRSATPNNPVTLRVAGGGVVWSGTVGAGDTFIATGTGSQTVIAQTGSRTITKATGPQTFNDLGTETRTETDTRTETSVTSVRGGGASSPARQPGPRTDRCAPLGGSVLPLR